MFRVRALLPLLAPRARRHAHGVTMPESVIRKMDSLLSRHVALTRELENAGDDMSATARAAKAKELASLQTLATLATQWKATEAKIVEAEQLIKECDAATSDGREMVDLRTCPCCVAPALAVSCVVRARSERRHQQRSGVLSGCQGEHHR